MPASDVFIDSFQMVWSGFADVVPQVVFGLVLLIFGWIVSSFLEQIVGRVLKAVKLNDHLERAGALEVFKRADVKFDASWFLGAIVRWFVLFVFLMAVADLLGLSAFNEFLGQVLLYVPNIVLAALILLVTAIAGDILDRIVSGSVRAAGFGYASMIGSLARWSVFVFGFVAALQQLGIATELLQTLVTGLVAMIAIAGGLAFGMGGKEIASDILEQIRRKIS